MNESFSIVEPQRLVLDTHILIWYVEGIKLTEEHIDLIEKSRTARQLYISAISVWEIAMLASKGRIVINIPIKEWVERVVTNLDINLIDLSPDILIESSLLPNYEYKDPADRMIIASVRSTNSQLMTFDQKIIDYANIGYLKLCIVPDYDGVD